MGARPELLPFRLGAGAPVSSGVELSPEERCARQLCKILAERRLDRQTLQIQGRAAFRETSIPRRRAMGEEDVEKAVGLALVRGWIVEQAGLFSATEAGKLVARRTRTGTRKSRGEGVLSSGF